jgi:hypothetical protein
MASSFLCEHVRTKHTGTPLNEEDEALALQAVPAGGSVTADPYQGIGQRRAKRSPHGSTKGIAPCSYYILLLDVAD